MPIRFLTLSQKLQRPVIALGLISLMVIAYLSFEIQLLRLIVERGVIFGLQGENYLSLEPYYWSKPVIFFVFLSVIIFCTIQRETERLPHFSYQFSWLAFLFNLSGALLFLSFTHFITQDVTWFQAHSTLGSAIWYFLGIWTTLSVPFIFLPLKPFGKLFQTFRRQWIIAAGFAFVFIATFPLVQNLWRPLSWFVGKTVAFGLRITVPGTYFNPSDLSLHIKWFVTSIGRPCSGVEGMSLFLVLYTAVLVIDWKDLHKGIAFLLYPVGLLMMFISNIIRIYAIELLGWEVSRNFGADVGYKIVMDQFHSHFGWIFYTLVILVFFKIVYPYITKRATSVNAV